MATTGYRPPSGQTGDRLASSALRASVAASPAGAASLVVLGLAGAWLLTVVFGGARNIVPHWYYLPILFTAVRFGPRAALVVALVAGVLAGPLTPLEVASGTPQEAGRWLTRTGFFVVVGTGMAALVRPALPSIVDELRRRRDERRLREAIADGQLFLRYQPIVDLATGNLHGVEALVRWQHPEEGELPPGAFLPAAEETEAIHDLGTFVLAEACRQAAHWSRGGRDLPPLRVTVNMSARELEAPDLITRVRDALAFARVDPSLVCLEITESVLAHDLDVSVERLEALRELGVRLAVDDFGTGYSSLAAVHRYPVDVLKVDRSFVAPLGEDTDVEALLGGIVLFARSLGLTTVAEGVETDVQAARVTQIGYDLAQGYRYARPLTADQVDLLLAAQAGTPDIDVRDTDHPFWA